MTDIDTGLTNGANGGATAESVDELPPGQRIAKRPVKRLLLGQTAVDFWGRRTLFMAISAALIVISVLSLSLRWLNLGIDFEGGVAFDVPSSETFNSDDAKAVLDANGISSSNATVESRRSSSGDIIKIQIADQPDDVREEIQIALAEAADVQAVDVSVSSVSGSWGSDITRKAVIALAVFLGLLAIVIAIRFEWRMALSAILAMLHDVVISAGIYSVFGFEVTPPTVIAFLTILGYSLYDTIVVFDRVKENEPRIANAGLSGADLVNVSTNQVLMRSLNTSISATLPVISLLVVGSGILGQVTLREFSLALLVGMLTGAYSSIFVATPILGWLKGAGKQASGWLSGEDLRRVVVRGVAVLSPKRSGRRRRTPAGVGASDGAGQSTRRRVGEKADGSTIEPSATIDASAEQVLNHPPRPRKKKRH